MPADSHAAITCMLQTHMSKPGTLTLGLPNEEYDTSGVSQLGHRGTEGKVA